MSSSDQHLPQSDAVLDVPGSSCAYLMPLIKQHITALPTGAVLEVRSDDPAVREGVPAWSRLTGHPLVAVLEGDAERPRLFLRRK